MFCATASRIVKCSPVYLQQTVIKHKRLHSALIPVLPPPLTRAQAVRLGPNVPQRSCFGLPQFAQTCRQSLRSVKPGRRTTPPIAMGSINCKEYATTTNNESCSSPAGNGISGSYHATPETEDMNTYGELVTLCHQDSIEENEMLPYDYSPEIKVLVIKQNGEIKVIGNRCPHVGAPLHTGTLGKGRVRCPWHGACFDIETGDIEDFPGMDSLPFYKVEISESGMVGVRGRRRELEKQGFSRQKDMMHRRPAETATYVLIGGGPASGVCVETLRQEGFTGRIVLICRENCLPYNRVAVSKNMDSSRELLQFRDQAFYDKYGIETMVGVTADRVDTENLTVHCSNGSAVTYNKLFIATGSRPVVPPIPGANLKNVRTLRDISEANEIYAMLEPNLRIVILGASFVALETATVFIRKTTQVTIIGREDQPLKRALGAAIGERLNTLFTDNGAKVIMNSGIVKILPDSAGNVKQVVLTDGTELACDLLLLATGSSFNTEFLKGSGVKVNPNGSIDTDQYLMTNVGNVYAGGDIANAPVFVNNNQRATIGHIQLAQYHGRIAAIHMAGGHEKLRAVPFFSTMLLSKMIRYSGYGAFKDVVIDGELETMKFAAYFINEDDRVVSIASCQRDPIVAQFAEMLVQGKPVMRADVESNDPSAWTKRILNDDSCPVGAVACP